MQCAPSTRSQQAHCTDSTRPLLGQYTPPHAHCTPTARTVHAHHTLTERTTALPVRASFSPCPVHAPLHYQCTLCTAALSVHSNTTSALCTAALSVHSNTTSARCARLPYRCTATLPVHAVHHCTISSQQHYQCTLCTAALSVHSNTTPLHYQCTATLPVHAVHRCTISAQQHYQCMPCSLALHPCRHRSGGNKANRGTR